MKIVEDIIKSVESMAGHALNRDEGVQHAESDVRVTGATVCWMADPSAIRAAGEAGHELLVCHESLYFPYDVINSTNAPTGWEQWKVNRERRRLLDAYGLTALRIHGTADEICIFDVFAGLLGLGDPVYADGLVKIYEIDPAPLGDILLRVKERFGMKGVRVAGVRSGPDRDPAAGHPEGLPAAADLSRPVRRIGLPWGGLGLFVNVSYQQSLVEQGCDLFIAGESDNYGFRFAVESGIPMIETSHEISENPGLRRFTELLASKHPDISFRCYENPCIWSFM